MNKLEQLKTMTTVVADTGDINAIKQYAPIDATTNPSLVLKTAQMPQYQYLVKQAVAWSIQWKSDPTLRALHCANRLAIDIGIEILNNIPGRISTEVDARLSFDTQKTVSKAMDIVESYAKAGISTDRLLIKIASTWEGINAAELLEKEGIKCNLTLLFSFAQASACADAGAYLISPFVGRIFDWHMARNENAQFTPEQDPGVQSVKRIFNFYKQFNYSTIVMGASFRSIQQIEQLAGCDRLTISPDLLEKLKQDSGDLPIKLNKSHITTTEQDIHLNEAQYRWMLNEDVMATEKLAEGIRSFALDQNKLEQLIAEMF
jgi:transaldolase